MSNKLKNVVLEGIDMEDYPDFSDAYISYAEWNHCGLPLTDSELDKVNQDTNLVYDLVLAKLF